MSVLRRARENTLVETAILLVVAVVLAIVLQAFAVKPYRIPSSSMEPTLHVGDRVLVDRFGKRILGHEPKVGDIAVFHPPAGADPQEPVCGADGEGQGSSTPCSQPTPQKSSQSFIKRVVGVGGDRIALRGGHVIRNGKPVSEPFAAPCEPNSGGCDFPTAITVPEGDVYLLGDNRGNSDDSRFWGPVPLGWVIGKSFATYWPPKRIGGAG